VRIHTRLCTTAETRGAGYHRLWSHRSYRASRFLQVLLLCGGTSAVQGSCLWWAGAHRSHHRYTDTDLDPYNSQRGLFWTHVGWMIFKTRLHAGKADVSDLRKNNLVQWQHRWYFWLAGFFGCVLPAAIPGFFWGDWAGGFCFSAALRLTIAHHVRLPFGTFTVDPGSPLIFPPNCSFQSTFCINSIAHYLGSASYDDALTPKDHFLSAILTMGEGYHNFHHQFPMDYRNAILWYQYDPTKWFIAMCNILGLASDLQTFPSNEIQKGALAMKLKNIKKVQDSITWPSSKEDLPVVSWETCECDSI
jgi:stearoyl-CoA desaturase (delta-9 desaturase)